MGEKIFVTGANGQLGLPLIKALVAAGHQVTGLARNEKNAAKVKQAGASECLVGDMYDLETLGAGCRDAQRIYHLAGAIRGPGRETPDRINRLGTENLLTAMERAGCQPASLLFASSCAVYGDRSGLWIQEDFGASPQTNYGRSKTAAENLLLDAWRARGLPVIIARIGIVYGPRFSVLLERPIKAGKAWLPGEGQNLMPVIHVDDCIAALQLLTERGEAGGVYHVATPNPVESRHFYAEVAQRLGSKAPRYWSTYLPSRVQMKLADINERLLARLDRRALLTPDMLRLLTASVRLKPERLADELDFTWRHPELGSGLDASFAAS